MQVLIASVTSTSLPNSSISIKVVGTAPRNNRVEVTFDDQSNTKKVTTADGNGNYSVELTIPAPSNGNHNVNATLIDDPNSKTTTRPVAIIAQATNAEVVRDAS